VARVRLSLLGAFRLERAGAPLRVPPSSQRLLAFVALHERPLRRAFVAGTLWIDSPEERAAANLRSALWRLRRTGSELVEAAGPLLALGGDVDVDLRESEELARDVVSGACPDLALDAAAFASDLLPDWYDDWVLLERERYRQLRLRALERLCERLADAGRLDEALASGLAAAAAEPLRESAHRAIVRVHLANGNSGEALRQYRLYAALLRAQLGLEPSPLIRELLAGAESREPVR